MSKLFQLAIGLVCFVSLLLAAGAALAEPITIERVIDGDTFDVIRAGEPDTVRLEATDTPESYRPACDEEKRMGEAATAYVETAFEQATSIDLITKDNRGRFGRLIGRIELDGRDLGQMLIDAGLAEPWPNEGNRWCQ